MMPHPRVLLRGGCMVSRMEVTYVFLCVYITLADWLLLLLAPKSGGPKHAFENSVGARSPRFQRLCKMPQNLPA